MKKKTTKQAKATKKPILGKVTFTPPIPFEMLNKVAREEYAIAVTKELSAYLFLWLQEQYEMCRDNGTSPISVCEHLSSRLESLADGMLRSSTDNKLSCTYVTKKRIHLSTKSGIVCLPKDYPLERTLKEGVSKLYMDAILASQPFSGHYTEKVVNKPKHCKKPIVRAVVEKYATGKFDKPSREELKG